MLKSYFRSPLQRLERLTNSAAGSNRRWLAIAGRGLIALIAVLLSPILIPLYLAFEIRAVSRVARVFLDSRSTKLIAARTSASDRPGTRVVIVANDWPKCGSTLVYNSQIASFLALGHKVDLVVFSEHYLSSPFDSFWSAMYQRLSRVLKLGDIGSIFAISRRASASELRQFLSWRFAKPPKLECHCTVFHPSLRDNDELIRFVSGAEIIVCNRVTFINYFDGSGVPIYLETHDIMHETRALQHSDAEMSRRSRAYELELASKAAMVGCFTQIDLDFYKQQAAAPVMLSSFSLPEFPEAITRRSTSIKRVVFFGDNHPQNVAGLQAVLDFVPESINLSVIGNVCRGLEGRQLPKNVVLKGFTPDLQAALAEHDAIVVPDFAGTGISVKMIEALAYGMPMYFTKNATRGLTEKIALPSVATASEYPREFFSGLSRDAGAVLAVDWLAIRKAVLREFSIDAGTGWARTVLEGVSTAAQFAAAPPATTGPDAVGKRQLDQTASIGRRNY